MIHTLLNLTRPLIVADTETTGLHPEARIVEIGLQRWTATGLEREWRSLINPGVLIPPAVTAIHGITDEMVKGCQTCKQSRLECACEQFHAAPYFHQIADSLATGFSNCDFAGKNIRYDLGRFLYEFQVAKVPWDFTDSYIVDADRLEQLAEPRSLSHLYKKYKGEELEGAHGALTDVRGTTDVIVGQLQRYEILPRSVAELHALSWPGWLTTCGSFKMVGGVPTCMLKKYRDVPMDKVPSSYYDWILSANFPPDVRRLASEAKLGRFPTCTPEEAKTADKRMI